MTVLYTRGLRDQLREAYAEEWGDDPIPPAHVLRAIEQLPLGTNLDAIAAALPDDFEPEDDSALPAGQSVVMSVEYFFGGLGYVEEEQQ